MPEDICWMSALEISEAVRNGKLSPTEVVDAFLERIKEHNPKINAIVTLTELKARESAKGAEKMIESGEKLGPLHGVPVTIKDLTFTKGIRTTFGSKLFEDYVPKEDAVLVERLKKAGAIILGKTNTPEFGMAGITDNLMFGHTRNPWDTSRTTGGSSGGAAAAVAVGFCPIAHGTDGGGSIRNPASFCGVYGLKPSFGRIPEYPTGFYPGSAGRNPFTSDGTITRTVSDAALAMDVMVGPDDRDRFSLPPIGINFLERLDEGIEGKRLAYSPDLGYAKVDPEVEKITEKSAFSFDKLGCEVSKVDLDVPFLAMRDELEVFVLARIIVALKDRLPEWKEEMYPLSRRRYQSFVDLERSTTARDLARVLNFKREEELWGKIRKVFESYDFLLTPTIGVPAFKIKERGPLGPDKVSGEYVFRHELNLTYPFSLTGQPAASLPCGFTRDNLPVGLQIVGNRYDDIGVLQASRAYEKAFPWQKKKPPL